MKKCIIIVLLLCLAVSLFAKDEAKSSPVTVFLGLHCLYHFISLSEIDETISTMSATEQTVLNILFFSRMGIDLTFLGNITGSYGLGGELFLDMDVISFLAQSIGLGVIEFGARILYSMRMSGLRVTPLAGIRCNTYLFMTNGYNLEGGLKLALVISKDYVLEAEGTYTFYGFGELYYPPHITAALALNVPL